MVGTVYVEHGNVAVGQLPARDMTEASKIASDAARRGAAAVAIAVGPGDEVRVKIIWPRPRVDQGDRMQEPGYTPA